MKISTDKKKIEELLSRGVVEIIDQEHLKKRLESGERLRIKFGIDPTGSSLHIGHAVPLRKLRQFQELGHEVILLIGDYTAMIGDPTGRDVTRPLLTEAETKENMRTYLKQASQIIDVDTLEVRYNSEWYAKPNFMGLIMELTGFVTIARILERDDFQKRLKEGSDIKMQETLYPLLQGYDSVMLHADLEIGGTDQKFNLLMGRRLQKKYKQSEQDVLMTPILEGIDGEKKMSKTYDNYIGLTDTPEDIFGKAMSIPDNLIIKYFELATDVSIGEVERYRAQLKSGINPKDVKINLAYAITGSLHGEKAAKQGQSHFETVFQSKEKPEDIPELKPTAYDIITVLKDAKFATSTSDARRTIEGGGVKINDKKVTSYEEMCSQGDVVQKGKRFFVKIK